MTHDEMNELYELYVLGALEPAEAAEIDEHVRTQCEHCISHISDATLVAASLSGVADLQKPPARLRQRVIASVKPERAKNRGWFWAVAGLSAACAGLIALAVNTASSVNTYRDQISVLTAERSQLREAVEILSRSETRTVQFGQADNQAHGRVFVNRNRGLVFVGSQLPQLAANRTFQLWLIPAAGAPPQSAGVFKPNAAGDFVNVRTTPIGTGVQAIAVSVEPNGGSPAPTTTPILVVPLG
jgi:anti-sigma-K factor RskA